MSYSRHRCGPCRNQVWPLCPRPGRGAAQDVPSWCRELLGRRRHCGYQGRDGSAARDGRLEYGEKPPPAPRGRIPKDLTPSRKGGAALAQVEPVREGEPVLADEGQAVPKVAAGAPWARTAPAVSWSTYTYDTLPAQERGTLPTAVELAPALEPPVPPAGAARVLQRRHRSGRPPFAHPHPERTSVSWFRTALGCWSTRSSSRCAIGSHLPQYLPLVGAWLVGAVRNQRLASVPAADLLSNPLALHGPGHRRGG